MKLLPGNPAYGRALGQHYRVLAETLVRLGDHAAAVQAVAEMPRPSPPDERVERFAAGILARCIPLAEQDSTLAVEKREALARTYGDQAMTQLRQALRAVPGPDADRWKVDPNLAPLRPRADYQKLVKELEEAGSK